MMALLNGQVNGIKALVLLSADFHAQKSTNDTSYELRGTRALGLPPKDQMSM